jgi:signal transduction histidine kinase
MNKLWVRLSLGFSGVMLGAVFMVALTGVLLEWTNASFERAFVLEVVSRELVAYYRLNQTLVGSEPILHQAREVFRRQIMPRGLDLVVADANGFIISHHQTEQFSLPLTQLDPVEFVLLQVDGETVGYLALVNDDEAARRPNFFFFMGRSLLTVAAVVGLSGIVFGILMSRSLTAPLNNLAATAKSIGARNLSRRVAETGSDEMIAVARAFNEMAVSLEQAEQLRRHLLADVAHELRTPLAVLQGNLRAILDEVYPLNQEEIARLYEQTRFLSRLINDLHELAQAEAHQLPLDWQTVDLRQLVKTTADAFRPSAEAKGVTLQTELPPRLDPIMADSARLRQILQNLLANALRHTASGGTITIQVEAQAGGAGAISVVDTGEGILPEHLPHIFDRFYRADPARSRDKGGTGLGLAIVRALVEAHGGQITAISTPGQGTTFMVKLPGKKLVLSPQDRPH